MPDNQLHKSQPDAISFCFVVLCQSWEELDKKNIRFGHWCWTRYPCITWRTKTVRSRCWQIWEGFMSSGMCHWMCDMIPNFRRNVAPSLSGVSSPSTYPTKGHNIPVDLNFHQHRCENLKRHRVNRYLYFGGACDFSCMVQQSMKSVSPWRWNQHASPKRL